MLGELFELLGYRATCVASGREALDLLSADDAPTFDAIFSDISMPEMDGYELAGKLREMRKAARLHTRLLIAMSGYGSPEDKEHARRSGFDRHVTKPPSLEQLQEVLSDARPGT